MRILLVQPNQNQAIGLQHLSQVEPLGLEMIGGALQDRHELALLDLRLQPDALADTLTDFRPHLVGISSTFTTDVYRALSIAEEIKEFDPHTFVFVGGHHPSLRPSDFRCPAIDAIVVGEGEATAREMIDCLATGCDLGSVPGLVLNRPEGQQSTGERPQIKNLDTLPYPARSLTRSYRQHYYLVLDNPIASLETARGCPYRCRFCSVWRFYRGRVRLKSSKRVVEELKTIEEPSVLFTDDNFLTDFSRAEEIARLIQKENIRKRYSIQARSDAIVRHPEIIAQWRKVGLEAVLIGFEKPDQKELDALNKHNSVENNERALEVCRENGIEPSPSFIVDPSYDHSDFAALRAYIRRLKLKHPAFTVLTPLPGTVLFDEMQGLLTTTNYELFDVVHAVLPTRLPLPEFYDELASLWREAYPRWGLRLSWVYFFLRDLFSQKSKPDYWKKVLTEGLRFGNARTYLKDWAYIQTAKGMAQKCVQI